jgi:hypothetical protein
MWEQERLLGEKRDAATVRGEQCGASIRQVEEHALAQRSATVVRTDEPGEDPEKCRLTRAVRSEHCEGLPVGDVEREVESA